MVANNTTEDVPTNNTQHQAPFQPKFQPIVKPLYSVDEGIRPFPKPILKRAKTALKVMKYSSMPTILSKQILEVDDGQLYEEGIELKDARFGKVHRIYRLQRAVVTNGEEETFIRTEEKLAVKKLHKRAILHNQEKAENPLHEIAALQLLLFSYESQSTTPSTSSSSPVPYVDCFTDLETIYLILPYYNSGDLLDLIFMKKEMQLRFQLSEMKEMFHQLASQLQRIHSLGLVHRDLSLENILYDKDSNQYTIIDYGMSLWLNELPMKEEDLDAMAASNEEKDSSQRMALTLHYSNYAKLSSYAVCGKQHYIAPEIWERRNNIEIMYSDIWSLGVIFFMVMMFQAPFASARGMDMNYQYYLRSNSSLEELIAQLNNNESLYSSLPVEDKEQYELLINLINKMLQPTPQERLTAEEILKHPFFL